ncbi:hypothetical protein Tco_0060410 [Tanacetum coccineum]
MTSAVGEQGINAVKPTAYWAWRPKIKMINHVYKNTGSCICKQFNYVDPTGRNKVFNSPCFTANSWLVQDQTVLALATPGQTEAGKESLNPFMAGSLPKTINSNNVDEESQKIGRQAQVMISYAKEYLISGSCQTGEDGRNTKCMSRGDLRMLFDPNEEDDIWLNQQYWELLRWKLHEYSGVHSLFLDGTSIQINMLVEKKYPLKKEILEKMINLKIEAEEERKEAKVFERILSKSKSFNSRNLRFKEEQAAKVSSQYWKPPILYDDDDDDDEESSIPLRDIISELPLSVAIIPGLPITDSLIMEDEHLNTIPKTESDEVIKFSVEDYSFSEVEEKSMTFSNPLFDSNDDFTSSDDESLSDEDVLEENVKIYSNPLFEFDDEYISSDVNPLFDEVLENIESKDSYVSNHDEQALLVTPFSDDNEDECFDPGGDLDEIEFLLHRDPSKISVDSILEGFTDEPLSKRMMIYLIWNLKRMNGRRFCTMLQLMI